MKILTIALLILFIFSCGGGNESSSSNVKKAYKIVEKDTLPPPKMEDTVLKDC